MSLGIIMVLVAVVIMLAVLSGCVVAMSDDPEVMNVVSVENEAGSIES